MDFEWEKLINGESDIDADDINALADGIIENEKKIKAIKDIMDNGGTIPEYLTNFFKKIPDGLSIDDLCGYKYIGCYLIEETQNVYGLPCDVKYLLFVNTGVFANSEEQRDEGHIFQTRYYFDAYNGIVKIQTRMDMYNEAPGLWEDWQDVFATPQYVKEQIAQIPTGGGGSDDTRFPVNPQMDITLEEEVKILDITSIGDVPLSDSNYTAMKIVIENAVLPEKGANSSLTIHINCESRDFNKTIIPGMITTFLNNTTKQFWGGYCDLKSGIVFGNANAVAQYNWNANATFSADTSDWHKLEKIERINLQSVTTVMPIGTKFKLWFK